MWWSILFLCILYCACAEFTLCILVKTFNDDKYAKYDLLFIIASYIWVIALVGYIIWGTYRIIKDFISKKESK